MADLERNADDAIDRLVDTLVAMPATRPRDVQRARVRAGGARATGRTPQVADPTFGALASWEAEVDRAVWWLVGGWSDGEQPVEHDGFVQRTAEMLARFEDVDPGEVLELVDNLRGVSPTSPASWRPALYAIGTWLHGAVTVLRDGWQASYRDRLIRTLRGLDVEDQDADQRCTWLLTEIRELLGPLIRQAETVAQMPVPQRDLVHCTGACDGANLAKYRRLERCESCRRAELRTEAKLREISGL